MENTYDLSIEMATELGASVKETGSRDNTSCFLRIRNELNFFLLSLNHSNSSNATGQQIHFLFIALGHLDNIEKEIRISASNEGEASLERVQNKIRGLKHLILNYIKHLLSEN